MTATDKQKANLKPFKKGDPRINRRGVPADTLAARAFIRDIGAELLALPDTKDKDGNLIPGEKLTRMKALIRSMFSSRAPADKAALLKGAYPGLLTDTVALQNPDGTNLMPVMDTNAIAERVASLLEKAQKRMEKNDNV